jgi:flagellar biosynthesis/type III secretory pathway M-ring protein FliF/YscJ
LPGAPLNTSDPTAVAQGPGKKKLSETRNFELGHVVSRTLGPKVQLRRLHVAILVDGIPEETTAGASETSTRTAALAEAKLAAATGTRAEARSVAAKEPKRFRVRTKDELDQIAALAREAAGLDPSRGDRIEVHSAPFFDQKTEDKEVPIAHQWWEQIDQKWLMIGGGAALLLVIGAMGALALLVRRATKKKEKAEEEPTGAMPLLPVSAEEAESALGDGQKAAMEAPKDEVPSRERALEAAKADPVKAAAILSAWLAESTGEARGIEAPRHHENKRETEARGEAA